MTKLATCRDLELDARVCSWFKSSPSEPLRALRTLCPPQWVCRQLGGTTHVGGALRFAGSSGPQRLASDVDCRRKWVPHPADAAHGVTFNDTYSLFVRARNTTLS